MQNTPAMTKMIKARIALMMNYPFFGQLALKLRMVEDPSILSCGVNSTHLIFNPNWIISLSAPQIKGLVAHEVMHLVYMHHTRKGARNHEKWNTAGDFCINPMLLKEGFVLPPDGCIDSKYDNMTTDHIYNLLPDEINDQPYRVGFGEVLDDAKGKSPAEINQAETEMKISIAEAAQTAKMMGKLPGGLEIFLGELMAPQVDWREKLRMFINQIARDDYDWSKPNRRFMEPDDDGFEAYWPRLYSEEAGMVAVAIDTSGSVSNKELEHFFGELNAIIDEVRPSKLEILDIDTRIHQVREFTSDEYPIDWKKLGIKGRGGTKFSPAFKYYKSRDDQPQCLIYLTDLCSKDFGEEPEFPVLWISTSKLSKTPFGEVTNIKVQ